MNRLSNEAAHLRCAAQYITFYEQCQAFREIMKTIFLFRKFGKAFFTFLGFVARSNAGIIYFSYEGGRKNPEYL